MSHPVRATIAEARVAPIPPDSGRLSSWITAA
jgi:hypothetical protein